MFSTVISETRLCLGGLTAADAREDLVAEHRQICDLMQGATPTGPWPCSSGTTTTR